MRVLFRSIPKKRHYGQALAVIEGLLSDAGNTVRDRDTRQAFASLEGPIPDTGDAISNRNALQVATF